MSRVAPYEAILFDFDGVLVDSEPVHFTCWQDILAPFHITLDWDYYEANCIGISDRAMLETLCRRKDPPLEVDVLMAEYPAKKALFRDRMLAGEPISAAVRDLVAELAKDFRLGAVTSSGRTEVEPILEASGLLRHFKTVVYGGDVQHLKPAPDPYLLAMRRLGASRGLAVEDSAPGVASARAAGLDVVEVPTQSEMCRLVRDAIGAFA
jgi:beta-phosphoglucomutase